MRCLAAYPKTAYQMSAPDLHAPCADISSKEAVREFEKCQSMPRPTSKSGRFAFRKYVHSCHIFSENTTFLHEKRTFCVRFFMLGTALLSEFYERSPV
jgi:hypothetical protein